MTKKSPHPYPEYSKAVARYFATIGSQIVTAYDGTPTKIDDLPFLTQEQERDLASRRTGEEHCPASEVLINHNLRVVPWFLQEIYKPINRTAEDARDHIQEGNMGLIRAVQKFDLKKNTRFITYATKWIRAKVQKVDASYFGAIKVPARFSEFRTFHAVNYVERCEREGTEPNWEGLAKFLKIARPGEADYIGKGIAQTVLESMDRTTLSLDYEYSQSHKDSNRPIQLQIEDFDDDPSEQELLRLATEIVIGTNGPLDETEKMFLVHKLGLTASGKKHNNRELGELVGHSREMGRKTAKKAMKKTRRYLERLSRGRKT